MFTLATALTRPSCRCASHACRCAGTAFMRTSIVLGAGGAQVPCANLPPWTLPFAGCLAARARRHELRASGHVWQWQVHCAPPAVPLLRCR